MTRILVILFLTGTLSGCSILTEIAELNERSTPIIELFTVDPNEGFASQEVLLEWRVSDLDSDTLTCTLSYGDGNEESVEHCHEVTDRFYAYAEPGSYIATLTATDENDEVKRTAAVVVGAQDAEELSITSFTAQPARGPSPLLTVLSWTLETDGPATCTLSFGDGSSDEVVENCQDIAETFHTFEEPGGYRVILEAMSMEDPDDENLDDEGPDTGATTRKSLIVIAAEPDIEPSSAE